MLNVICTVLVASCNLFANVKNKSVAAALAVCGLYAVAECEARAALPDIGYDVTDTITDLGTKLGLVVGACVALFAIFLVIKKAMKWMRSTAG